MARFGGSWGSTLIFDLRSKSPFSRSQFNPTRNFHVSKKRVALVLSGWGKPRFSDAFEPYRDHIPIEEQGDLIKAYYARLTSDDVEVRRGAAKRMDSVGNGDKQIISDPEYLDKAEDLDFAVAFARIECHYFINAIFVEEAYILNNSSKIKHIPTTIVQGRYDMVCPPRSAWQLHKTLPDSKLVMVADAGHSMGEVSIARELVAATDAIQ